MRRVFRSVVAGLGLIGLGVGLSGPAVSAAPTLSATASAAVQGKKVCTIKDERLVELSGLVATESGYIVINDSSEVESRKKIFYLDNKCNVKKAVSYSGVPRDPEDLVLAPDGKTLYIADIGDNPTSKDRRSTVALWTMPVDGSRRPVIHRLTYPDGPHDAEALLFKGDGTPIIVTKESGKSALYAPTGPLQPNTQQGVPMEKLGEVKIPSTKSSHPLLGAVARMFVTGGATAPDGSRVVLRTYTDAFEWDVKDGDVVAALTTGTPRVTPLSDDPFGEAISYTPDGKLFVTVSETESLEGEEPTIFSYTPSTSTPEPVGAGEDRDKDAGPSFLDRIGLQGIMYLVSAVGALGAILVVVGVVAILRARRRPTTPGDEGADGDGPPTRSSASAPPRGRTYGGGADSRADGGYRDVEPGYERDGRAPSGRVYGAGGGAVYGGGRPAGDGRGDASGTVYGAGGGTVYGGTGGAVYGGASGAVYGGRAGSVYGGDYDGRGRGGDGYYHDGGYR